MLPQNHFGISAASSLAVTFTLYPSMPFYAMIKWALVAGTVSALVDLDIVYLVHTKSKRVKELRKYLNPAMIFRDFKNFMDTILRTGVLKLGMISHSVVCLSIIILSFFLLREYFVPATIGAVTHLLSDLPNVSRLIRQN